MSKMHKPINWGKVFLMIDYINAGKTFDDYWKRNNCDNDPEWAERLGLTKEDQLDLWGIAEANAKDNSRSDKHLGRMCMNLHCAQWGMESLVSEIIREGKDFIAIKNELLKWVNELNEKKLSELSDYYHTDLIDSKIGGVVKV